MDKVAKEAIVWLGIIGTGYWLYKKITGSASQAIDGVANAIAGALVPDANASVQSETSTLMAALKAAGSPRVGSDVYNQTMIANGHPELVVTNSLTGQGGG